MSVTQQVREEDVDILCKQEMSNTVRYTNITSDLCTFSIGTRLIPEFTHKD